MDILPEEKVTKPASNEHLRSLVTLLGIYTANLAKLLERAALCGGEIYAPLDVRNQIEEQRRAIESLKQQLGQIEAPNPPLTMGTPIASAADLTTLASSLPSTSIDTFTYDVFLSYHQQEPDKTWVRKRLQPQLEAAGLTVCIDYRDFRLGAPLVLEMARAVEQSRYTIAVLSPRYLTSGFTELETILAEHLGLESSQQRLLAVVREPCTPRLGMRIRMWLDMTDDDEFEANVKRLIHELVQPVNV